ncbi:MAG: dethiobiotin synthase [Elainellaceae cyanobacterium]
MQTTLLVTGTAAGIGKTLVTLAIAAYHQTYVSTRSLALFKLIDAGSGDADYFKKQLSLTQSPESLTPCQLQSRLDPPLAAQNEGIQINLAEIWRQYQALTQTHDVVLVEACGGLGTPLTLETTVAELAWDWRLPTLLVVPVRAGAIGEAIAHVALARQSRVHIKGIVLNTLHPCSDQDAENLAPASLVQSLTQVPVLGRIPYFDNPNDLAKLAHVVSNFDVERLLPLI